MVNSPLLCKLRDLGTMFHRADLMEVMIETRFFWVDCLVFPWERPMFAWAADMYWMKVSQYLHYAQV